MKKVSEFLNPLARLGRKKSSAKLAFGVTVITSLILEIYANYIVHDPDAVGIFAIFLFVILIIYFAFRDGIRGGITAATITILYYFYIVYNRHYSGEQLTTSLETIVALGLLYFFIAIVIGWLKGSLDKLIEREANERKRLQAVIQQLPLGIAISNKEGVIEDSNKQLDSILGVKVPKGFATGSSNLIPAKEKGHEIPASRSSLIQALKTGKEINREIVITRPNGKERTISVRAAPIRNRKKEIFAAVSIVDDISDQRELEARKDEFINTASHELKTPLTSMFLYFDLLSTYLKRSSDDKSINTLKNVRIQAERLLELVNDLLDVSRLQTGKLAYRKEIFPLHALIKESVESFGGGIKKHYILFKDTSKIWVYGDRFRIYQVLTNLLTNAIKYSPEKSKIIINIKKEKGKVIVSVKDEGVGIEKEDQKKIFNKLYQADENGEKSYGGLGMGLYISKEIVKRHGGKIWVESTKGEGSTFYFSLPTKNPM